MKSKKPGIKEYFHFSRKDRIAAIAFALIVGGLIALPHFLPQRASGFAALPDSLLRPATQVPDTGDRYAGYPHPEGKRYPARPDRDAWKTAPLFFFDPNTLDAAGWSRLGLPERNIETILRYRDKGGRFRHPEDLGKIWSLPPGFVDRVMPYLKIEGSEAPKDAARPASGSTEYTRPERKPGMVSINEADSAAWEALPGIGARLAGRITRFRDRLGGFTSVNQVSETFGLQDSTFQRVRPFLEFNSSALSIRKLNLNTATVDELKVHPYLRWKLANAIIEYRKRHGNYTSVDDLRKLLILPDSVIFKVAPYLVIK